MKYRALLQAEQAAAGSTRSVKEVEVRMQELIDSLERCVRQSTFVSDRMGKIGWNDYRRLFRTKRWDDPTWMHWSVSKLEIEDVHVADLEARLEPVLAEFMHTGTGRIGNGLFLLLGGWGTWAHPTVAEFARTLIRGAVGFGARPVAARLLGWASGEPLRYRISALLEGTDIDEELQLAEGIRVWKLPNSSADLPALLPKPFFQMATVPYFSGDVVMSIDCEMSPSLYRPDEDEVGGVSSRSGEFRMVSGKVPNLSLDSFCESVSLACNGCVDWFVKWRDFESLEAFKDTTSSSGGWKIRSGARGTKVSQASLNEALKIHHARYGGGGPRESLELAMQRWIRSKRSGTDPDKLIELRIALEAMYEIGGATEKGFRVATYGAWHLGENFEQRHAFRETLHKVYSDSSSAVHGGKLKYAAKDPKLVSSAQDICRNGILKRLEETERPKWDEMILGARE